ncbi:MAG: ParB/RepB/Spo0J family partition protein [Mycobacteriales bacterium]|nr:ParB/RepB/Spo0J family partition protein [Frankia sp.]
MTGRRGGLGRGLDALIPAAAAADGAGAPGDRGKASVAEVDLDAIEPNRKQPRTNFDETAHDELVASVREVGVLQPVVVRPVAAGRYELVMGERRVRAARAAGLTSIPALVRATPDEALLRDALIENIHRAALNPLEEAAAYRQLLDDFGTTHDEVATRVGRSRAHVTNTMRLLQLPAPVQRRVAAGVLSAGHARALLAVADPAEQEALATRVVAEAMSVRALEELIALRAPGRRGRRRVAVEQPAAVGEVAARLSELLETRVRVEMGRRKGRIVVEFGSADDLERVASLLALSLEVTRPRD